MIASVAVDYPRHPGGSNGTQGQSTAMIPEGAIFCRNNEPGSAAVPARPSTKSGAASKKRGRGGTAPALRYPKRINSRYNA